MDVVRVKLTVAASLVCALSGPIAAAAMGSLVYMGTDPSCHFGSFPEGVTLARNAVVFASGKAQPEIAYVNFDCSVGDLLDAAGFTNLTSLSAGNLDTTDLTAFDVLWTGHFPTASDVMDLAAASSNIQSFIKAGGSLIVEPEFGNGALDWAWAPFGTQIGNMDLDDQNQTIVASHPITAGLTNAGLSNWGDSVHNVFETPEAAGFRRLVNFSDTGDATVIVRASGTEAPVLSYAALAGLALALAGAGVYRARRRAR